MTPYRDFPPFQEHSDTSLSAAEAIEPKAGTLRRLVLDHIKARKGATDEELCRCLKLSGNTVRPRRRELQLAGLVADKGDRRQTASGRKATVWVAT